MPMKAGKIIYRRMQKKSVHYQRPENDEWIVDNGNLLSQSDLLQKFLKIFGEVKGSFEYCLFRMLRESSKHTNDPTKPSTDRMKH